MAAHTLHPFRLLPAARVGDVDTVTAALADPLTDPNEFTDDFGHTALILACMFGQIEVATLLLECERVDPNIGDQDGDTALIYSAQWDNAGAVALLLKNERVDPNCSNESDFTALMISCRDGYPTVVTMLLADARVDPNWTSPYGSTALLVAAAHGRQEAVQLLLADRRTIRTRPNFGGGSRADSTFDAALREIKMPFKYRFRGLVRAAVAFRRMRLRAAEAVYAPGGAGFAAAAASFSSNALLQERH